MALVKYLIAGTLLILVSLFAGLMLLAAAAENALANSGVSAISPSEIATEDIPPPVLQAYLAAGNSCPGLPWTVIAGIGKIESNHGRYGGATIGPDQIFRPPIIGIPLDGRPGVARITDTDGGRLDRDRVWDRAVGPFQFIPTTWALFERSVGERRNPHYLPDGIEAVVWHLCPQRTVTNLEQAVFNYNRSQVYVDDVLEWAERYTGEVTGTPVAGYALPVPNATRDQAQRPHHDYPAWDIGVPVGTPLYAITAGTVVAADGNQPVYQTGRSRCGNIVTIEGTDQARYTYCHLSQVAVTVGTTVQPGQTIGQTGGQPGTPGAGNTTGPHLHLGIRGQGRSLCPQQLLTSILDNAPINPLTLPSTGCTN